MRIITRGIAEHPRGIAEHSRGSAEHSRGSAEHSSRSAGHSRGSAEHSGRSAGHLRGSAEHSSRSAGHSPPSSNAGYWIQLAVHVFHKIIIGFQLNWKKRIWIPTETRQHSWIPKATPNRRLDSKSKGQHSWIPKAPPNRRLDSKSKRRLYQDACWIPTEVEEAHLDSN